MITFMQPRTAFARPGAVPGRGPAPAPLAGGLWGPGLFYLPPRPWPLVSLQTFELVTGPKTDHWLVQTVGVLIAVVGLVLLTAAWRRHAPAEVVLLAVAAALALAGVDVVFVTLRVIDPVYLLDTAA